MTARNLVLVVLAALAVPARAQEPAPEAELQDLLAILAEETEVATRTRLNGDFVPGIVTVLHGDELEALGFETVGEALSLVPGVQAIRNRDGLPSTVVRGVDFPFNSGNIKVTVNGVALSRDNAGVDGIALQMPIQQVDRIEIIRGPGGVVHGDFAFMGLVNVVTRAQGRRAWARAGGDDARALGGTLAGTVCGWQLSAGLAGWRSHEPALAAPLQGDEDRGYAELQARHGGFALRAQGLSRDLDPEPGPTVDGAQSHWALDARYGREVRRAHAEAHATVRHNDFRTPGNTFEGDVVELGLDLDGKAGRHEWLLGTAFQRNDIASAQFRPQAPPGRPPLPALRVDDQQRDVWSVLAQDRFDLSPAWSLTAGARLDDDELTGTRFTPRIAVVWRASERHILKAQHAEGFRPPTFFELYGATGSPAPGLGFEVNQTTELNYVYRRARSVARATVFHMRLKDMIYVSGVRTFSNSARATADGVELEWEQQLGRRLRVLANGSWIDESETRTADRHTITSPLAARFLGNAAAFLRPAAHALLTARWNHVGERGGGVAGWDVLDVAARLEDLGRRGLSLGAGVRNATDEPLRYLIASPIGVQQNEFPGRTFWAQLSWESR